MYPIIYVVFRFSRNIPSQERALQTQQQKYSGRNEESQQLIYWSNKGILKFRYLSSLQTALSWEFFNQVQIYVWKNGHSYPTRTLLWFLHHPNFKK